jgi:hypothetical protein
VSMCMYLTPKGFRGDRPGWFLCTLTGKEVPKHHINNCVRGGCPDYRERDDEIVAGDKGKRIKWDEPASETVSESSDVLTLREWAQDEMRQGLSMNQLVKQIGCSWSTLNNAVKQPKQTAGDTVLKTMKEPSGSRAEETQPVPEPKPIMCACWNCDKPLPEAELREDGRHLYCKDCYRALCNGGVRPAAEPEELGTCWNCRQQFPADSMHPDGDTLECEDCYRRAHQPAPEPPPPAPPAARCQRCEAPVDGRLIMSGVGTVCEPCAEAIRQEWEAEQYPAPDTSPAPAPAVTRYCDPDDTQFAVEAYLKHIGMGDQEVFALGVWLAAWRARGEAA